jgi:hypothetical protein
MQPHHTKDDSLGSLTKAVNFERQQRKRHQDRQSKIKRFEKLTQIEKVKLWRKVIPRGRRGQHICFIRENDKVEIIDYLVNSKL